MFPTRLFALALLLASAAATERQAPLPNEPVPALDLQRYSGKWHEVARLPMLFQRKCVANTTATYTLRDDGKVDVRNACDKAGGETMVSQGVARPVPGRAGQMQVRFAPDWLAWASGCGPTTG